jgi:hypothetical protein
VSVALQSYIPLDVVVCERRNCILVAFKSYSYFSPFSIVVHLAASSHMARFGEVAHYRMARPSSLSRNLGNPKKSLFYLRSPSGLCCGMFCGDLATL